MSEPVQTTPENSISERLLEILDQLTADQIRFVIARQDFTTDKEAAESIDLKPDTVYHWKSREKAPLTEALKLMVGDGLIVAAHLRRRSLAKAMAVKVAGLDDSDDRLRQSVATEIIEWEMGRATQRQEHSGPDGEPIVFRFVSNVNDDKL